MKLAINTLGCPGWTWEQIVEQASLLGYDGIEVRGVGEELLLTKCPPFLPDNLGTTSERLKSVSLNICCLSTSCFFHDPDRYEAAVHEGLDAIDLAARLGVPYIRVFGDVFPDKSDKEKTIAAVAAGLQTLGQYAENKKVKVLIESHGDFADPDDLLETIGRTISPAIGVLWDVQVTFMHGSGRPVSEIYGKLRHYIHHVHLKDAVRSGEDERCCLPGQGDVPIAECVRLLRADGYDGWLSFEWEKRWHPEIEDPSVAFPAFVRYMMPLLQETEG